MKIVIKIIGLSISGVFEGENGKLKLGFLKRNFAKQYFKCPEGVSLKSMKLILGVSFI
jgi:hypothetical protein